MPATKTEDRNEVRNRQIWVGHFTDNEWLDFKVHALARDVKMNDLVGEILKAVYGVWADAGRDPEGETAEITVDVPI